jgi:hypothetical protein
MDIGPSETTIGTSRATLTRDHFSLGEMGLSEFTPFKYDKVANLDILFYKDRGRIVRQPHKNIVILRAPTISIIVESPLVMDIRNGVIYLASTGVAFSQVPE